MSGEGFGVKGVVEIGISVLVKLHSGGALEKKMLADVFQSK